MAGTSTSISSGVLAPGTHVLFDGRHILNSVLIQPGATVTIYDNTAASGKIVFLYVNAGTSTEFVSFVDSPRVLIGLTVVVAAANAIVYYGA